MRVRLARPLPMTSRGTTSTASALARPIVSPVASFPISVQYSVVGQLRTRRTAKIATRRAGQGVDEELP